LTPCKPRWRFSVKSFKPSWGKNEMSTPQFENLRASSLYCNQCKTAMPVRERLLLVLADKEIYDYLCTGCANSVGQREVTFSEKRLAQARPSRRKQAVPESRLLLP